MKTTKTTTIFLGLASAMAFAQEGSACIPFVNGSGNYDKHCYNEGLFDMEEGKCYTFNPARVDEAPVPQWVNDRASQTWWWVETPCIAEVSSSSVEPESSSSSEVVESSSSEEPVSSSSEIVEESSSSEIVEPESSSSSEIVEPESSSSSVEESSSSEEPLSSSSETPVSSSSEVIVASNCIEFVNGSGNYTENCYNAGLLEMEEGKCYAINPDRYNDVKNQLWINNIASQVWWWVETSCGSEISSSSEESSSSAESSSSVEESSSSVEESSSSVEESSSSVEESSSSVEESSSSVEESSSSVEESSSSVEESSSSVEESSSSVEESSSSVEESSSSSEIVVSTCIEFVNGSGNYIDNCYNAGLLEMEEGKCYAINPDRYNDVKNQLWINNIASQVWWWVETSCGSEISSSSEESSSSVESSSSEESSSSVESSSSEESSSSVESSSSEESSSSVESSSSEESSSSSEIVVTKCVEFVNGSGDYNGKCFNAGLNEMAEGKCYALNPDRGQVNDLWINNRAVDTYWWSEVACADEPEVVEEPATEDPTEIVCKGDDCADVKPVEKGDGEGFDFIYVPFGGFDDKTPAAEPKPAPAKVIGRDNGTTAIATAVAAKASMAVANNMLSIATNSNGVKSVKIFSVRGDILLSETFSGAAKTVDMAQFAGKGAVIVRLVEGRKVLATKRVAIR